MSKWATIDSVVTIWEQHHLEGKERPPVKTTRYATELVKIENTHLGYDDHSLRIQLDLTFASSATSIQIYLTPDRLGTVATTLISTILGPYSNWENLKNSQFYALWDEDGGMKHGMDIRGIMSFNRKRWVLFYELFGGK